jgi:hypothetical protein
MNLLTVDTALDQALTEFENRFATFCQQGRLDRNETFLWHEMLSEGVFGHVPCSFIWKHRDRPWNWLAIEKKYGITGTFMAKCRTQPWSYRYMLGELASQEK